MAVADYSSYHQNTGTTSDGSKFNNLIDAVQATVNALDNNNIAASAGIVASKLADPTTGKVLGSSSAACAAVFPPGYEYSYDELTSSVTGVVATTAGTATTIKTSSAVTFDGTAVWVEFYSPAVQNNTDGAGVLLELFEDSTDLGVVSNTHAPIANGGAPVHVKRRRTPSAGSHTYTVKAYVTAGSGSVQGGSGGAGVFLPVYIRVTKA